MSRCTGVVIWRIAEEWHPYPWRFTVYYLGKPYEFAGIPNQCETKRAAAARAGWRLKWLREGTFHKRYK